MATLWTPSGEHEVPKDSGPTGQGETSSAAGPDQGAPASDAIRAQAEAMGIDFDALSPEERAQATAAIEEMVETRRRIAEMPAADVIANHGMGLYELGAIHLSSQPPNFPEAALAIDALRAIVDGLGDRLGEAAPVLNEAMTQIQMAFVSLSDGQRQASDGPAEG